jgi:ribosomal protein S18 acetylase RimI-like enzyme
VSEVVVRHAVAADVPALEAVAVEAYSVYLPRMAGQRPGPIDADYAALVGSAEVRVATVDGDVAGFMVLVPGQDHLLLDNVAVRPSQQGHGLGRRLLALAEERAREAGTGVVRLYTHVSMVENQRLYERLGYVETGRRADDGLARVFYEKHLSR